MDNCEESLHWTLERQQRCPTPLLVRSRPPLLVLNFNFDKLHCVLNDEQLHLRHLRCSAAVGSQRSFLLVAGGGSGPPAGALHGRHGLRPRLHGPQPPDAPTPVPQHEPE